eukprot:Gb_21543 [translate_table: standard]
MERNGTNPATSESGDTPSPSSELESGEPSKPMDRNKDGTADVSASSQLLFEFNPGQNWQWDAISASFVTPLPIVDRKHDTIMLVMDRLTKTRCHLLPWDSSVSTVIPTANEPDSGLFQLSYPASSPCLIPVGLLASHASALPPSHRIFLECPSAMSLLLETGLMCMIWFHTYQRLSVGLIVLSAFVFYLWVELALEMNKEDGLMTSIIRRRAMIKQLAASYRAECLSYCQELLELQGKWEQTSVYQATDMHALRILWPCKPCNDSNTEERSIDDVLHARILKGLAVISYKCSKSAVETVLIKWQLYIVNGSSPLPTICYLCSCYLLLPRISTTAQTNACCCPKIAACACLKDPVAMQTM